MVSLNINSNETFTALFKDPATAEKAYELALGQGAAKYAEDIESGGNSNQRSASFRWVDKILRDEETEA